MDENTFIKHIDEGSELAKVVADRRAFAHNSLAIDPMLLVIFAQLKELELTVARPGRFPE